MGLKIVNNLVLSCLISSLICCTKSEQGPKDFISPELKLSLEAVKEGEKLKDLRLKFDVTNEWHIYGPELQKNGRPTTVSFVVNATEIEASNWPATKIFDEGESGPSNGYDGSFEVSAALNTAGISTEMASAKVTWVACKDICVPGETELFVAVN